MFYYIDFSYYITCIMASNITHNMLGNIIHTMGYNILTICGGQIAGRKGRQEEKQAATRTVSWASGRAVTEVCSREGRPKTCKRPENEPWNKIGRGWDRMHQTAENDH